MEEGRDKWLNNDKAGVGTKRGNKATMIVGHLNEVLLCGVSFPQTQKLPHDRNEPDNQLKWTVMG